MGRTIRVTSTTKSRENNVLISWSTIGSNVPDSTHIDDSFEPQPLDQSNLESWNFNKSKNEYFCILLEIFKFAAIALEQVIPEAAIFTWYFYTMF